MCRLRNADKNHLLNEEYEHGNQCKTRHFGIECVHKITPQMV